MSLTADQILELKAAFDEIDTNKDGYITKDELRAMLSGLGEPAGEALVNEMMWNADTNADGKVSFNEFVAAATQCE